VVPREKRAGSLLIAAWIINIVSGCVLIGTALMQLQGLQLLERCISGFVRPGRDVEGD